jgi:hypothetical protein
VKRTPGTLQYIEKGTTGVSEDVVTGNQILVLGLLVTVLLMILGVASNPEPTADLENIDQIVVYQRNQEKESKHMKAC